MILEDSDFFAGKAHACILHTRTMFQSKRIPSSRRKLEEEWNNVDDVGATGWKIETWQCDFLLAISLLLSVAIQQR